MNEKKTIQVIIATHKRCALETDPLYLPVQVGAAGKRSIGFRRDDEGENISQKNPHFCELTGLYWAWKNTNADYVGLCHYRRYFAGKKPHSALTLEEAQRRLAGRDGLLPSLRRYYIESLYSHYAHTSHIEPLDVTGQIIQEKHPAYTAAFERLKRRRAAHMFNMFILKKEHLDAYCSWLFDILFELEKRVDASAYTAFHARFFGRVSELLLDVWLEVNPLDTVTCPVWHVDGQKMGKRIRAFLSAKFLGKKYEKSF